MGEDNLGPFLKGPIDASSCPILPLFSVPSVHRWTLLYVLKDEVRTMVQQHLNSSCASRQIEMCLAGCGALRAEEHSLLSGVPSLEAI